MFKVLGLNCFKVACGKQNFKKFCTSCACYVHILNYVSFGLTDIGSEADD